MFSWLGLIRYIPKTLQNKFTSSQNDKCDTVESHTKNKSLGITSKISHQSLLKPLLHAPTAQKSLEQSLNLGNVDWSKIYLLPRVTSIESSLRSFQYKILKNTLFLNECLFKFNIVHSRSIKKRTNWSHNCYPYAM